MSTSLFDLPTELQLSILRLLKPRHLFVNVRNASTRLQALAEDIFRNDILPNICIDLNVWDEGNHQEYLTSKNVQLRYRFAGTSDGEAAGSNKTLEILRCTLRTVEPEERRERVLKQLRLPTVVRHAMQMSLPPSFVIAMKDNSWFEQPIWRGPPKNSGIADILLLDWKQLLAKYYKETQVFDNFAEGRSVGRLMFPMY